MTPILLAKTDCTDGWWGPSPITAENGALVVRCDGTAMFCRRLDHELNLSALCDSGAVHLRLYIEHAADIAGAGQFEITSSGQSDRFENCWNLYNWRLRDGWNDLTLRLDECDSVGGGADLAHINFTRVYLPLKRPSVMKIERPEIVEAGRQVVPCRVTYASCGGRGPMPAPLTVEAGTVITLADCPYTKEGYHFAGWRDYRTDGGVLTDPVYRPGDTFTVRDSATLAAVWELDEPHLPIPPRAVPVTFERDGASFSYAAGRITVSARGRTLTLDAMIELDPAPAPFGAVGYTGDPFSGDGFTVVGSGLDVTAAVTYRLDPAAALLTQKAVYRLAEPLDLREIRFATLTGVARELENDLIDGDHQHAYANYNSYPAFLAGLFCAVDYPVASTRRAGEDVVIAQAPFTVKRGGVWHETRTAVYGFARPDQTAAEAFSEWLTPRTAAGRMKKFHYNFNSWYSIGYPFDKEMILGLMDGVFGGLAPTGEHLDSFAIDMGWSDPEDVWAVNHRGFTRGLTPLREACEAADSRLGMWFSPSAAYPDALSPGWAARRGYPVTNKSFLCLHHPKYAAELLANIPAVVRDNGIRHVKADALFLNCHGEGHGHRDRYEAIETSAEHIIAVFDELRKQVPDIWIETTCLGYNPSPFWLEHVTSLVGAFGDDQPWGRVPAPDYRLSVTTGRDFYNLQGAQRFYAPVLAQDEMGVVHQTPSDFTDDLVTYLMRGNAFIPLYIKPGLMSEARWDRFAKVLGWARAHEADILGRTEPLLPRGWAVEGNTYEVKNDGVMPRTPYGYAHRNLWLVRNPWIEAQTFTLTVPASDRPRTLISLYPEARRYAAVGAGETEVTVRLYGYETLVLTLTEADAADLPTPASPIPAGQAEHTLAEEGEGSRLTLSLSCDVPEGTSLLLLFEHGEKMNDPVPSLLCDGQPLEADVTGSAQGWAATFLPVPEHWSFVIAPLAAGRHTVTGTVTADPGVTAAAYLRVTAPGVSSDRPDALPAPEKTAGETVRLF